jgi:hypothetical protein
VTICNRCGGVLSAQAKICQHCGALVSEAAGNLGGVMGARNRAEVRERAPLPPTFDPFAAFPAAPFPGMTSQPLSAGTPEAAAGSGRRQAPSPFGSEQLPDWLRPSTSELPRRGGEPGQSFQPRAGNDAFAPRPNQGMAPSSDPLGGVPPVNPMAPAARPPVSSSPYRSGGRNASDDLFAASSLLDQNKLPEWLRSRQERSPAPSQPQRAPEPRPTSLPGADPFAVSSVSENLPEWLRAMDPGAPPPTMSGRFGAGGPRVQPGAGRPSGASRSLNQERRELPERPAPAADPFGGNPASPFGGSARDPFGNNRPAPGAFGAPPAGSADPFAGRSAPGQPWEPRPRPLSASGPQGGPPAGMPQPAPSPFGPISGPGGPPFAGAGGSPVGGAPANGSPFSRQRQPEGSPFGPSSGPGASMYPAPSGTSPFGAASAFDAFAPRSAPFGSAPASYEPAAPFSERFAAAPAERTNLPDWLRIEERPPARPAGLPNSAPLYWPAEPAAPPSSAPLYRPVERIPPVAPPAPAVEAPQAMPASAQPLAPVSDASASPSPFDLSSLIEEDALPEWLSKTSQTEPLPLPITVADSVTGSKAPGKAGERASAGAGTQGQDTGRAAEREEDLPDWLRQVYSEARVPALEHQPAPAAAESAKEAPPSTPPAIPQAEVSNIFNAADLLDQHSMPDWLREASQTSPLASVEGPAPATPARTGPGAQTPESASFLASSLLDEASLPEWLRKIEADGPPAPFQTSLLPTTGGLPAGATSDIFSAAELIDTQALPAWLKSGPEPNSTPGTTPAPAAPVASAPASSLGSSSEVFSAAELVDTQMLPSWLKSAGEASGSSDPASVPPEGAALEGASGAFSPAELIDTQALPAWLKAEGTSAEGEQTANYAGSPEDVGADSGTFSPAELIDTQALPAWLKQEGAAPAPATSAADGRSEGVSKLSPLPAGFAKQQTGSFAAAELVDTQALPAWLKGATDPSASLPPTAPARSSPLAAPEGERFSAAELIDTQALPTWMKDGEAADPLAPPAPTSFSGPAEASAGSGSGFSAPELIDPQALPSWLQEAGAGGGAEAPSRAAAPQPSQQRQSQDPALPEAGSLVGASLIDHNELPGWLQGEGNFERPGLRASGNEEAEVPQARVPRRPRLSTEANRAPSQAAASVFSSVLGPVAGEEHTQAPLTGRGSPQRSQPGQPAGARRNSEPGGRAPAGSASPAESWEGAAPGRPASGEMPPARRTSPQAPEVAYEWEAPQGRRSSISGQSAGRAGGLATRGQGADEPSQQWRDLQRRDAPPGARQRFEEAGWEGGPEMPLGYAEDEDFGPPSGVFAKIKRVLGFRR